MPKKAFRRSANRLWLTAWSAIFFVLVLSVVFVNLGSPNHAALWWQFLLTPGAAASLWITVRVFRSGMFAGPDGLVVRNAFRTHRIPWSEIEMFTPPARYGQMRNAGIGICATGNRKFFANLYSAGPFNKPSFADPVLADLRAMLAFYRSD